MADRSHNDSGEYLLSHLDAAGRAKIAQALQAIETLDGFALYILATRANRQLVNLGYADRVQLFSGRTVTIVRRGVVHRVEVPENVEQHNRRIGDLLISPDSRPKGGQDGST